MDANKYMNHHIGNIKRSLGNGYNNYILGIEQSELAQLWNQIHDELGYPLMMDSKYRRALVYNKKGLEKQIEETIGNAIENACGQLANAVANDTIDQFVDMFNGLVQSANGTVSKGNTNNSNGMLNIFAKQLAKDVIKGVENIIEDTL